MKPPHRRPRIVLVSRKTPLQLLLERHGTHAQARFYLESRGQDIRDHEEAHTRFEGAMAQVQQTLPADQRRVRVARDDLDRFLFAPDDVVVIVGQDGLVPNVAKYLDGQLTIGLNPDPERYDGVLCRHRPQELPGLLRWLEETNDAYQLERRVMAVAVREDGQRLLALNEVFLGHRTHQSARYWIRIGNQEERHSSSGVICATGTGATGWARSISEQRCIAERLPGPEAQRLVWFVREPFPSVYTGTELDFGFLQPGESVEIASLMGEDGVIFADGIEQDRIEFVAGHVVRITIAPETLNLVIPATKKMQSKRGKRK